MLKIKWYKRNFTELETYVYLSVREGIEQANSYDTVMFLSDNRKLYAACNLDRQDWNIGSVLYPWYFSDACECNR